ncbi:hypothetical protein GCM10027074_40630 [Streptomyces deserti]
MFGGTTARTVVPILAAVLLALQFFAPTASFASAYPVRHVEAKAQPGTEPSGSALRTGVKLSGKALRDESVTCRGAGHLANPTGPLRTRDRFRAANSVPAAPERPLLTLSPSAVQETVGSGAAHHRTPRPAKAHTPAALQVFRC